MNCADELSDLYGLQGRTAVMQRSKIAEKLQKLAHASKLGWDFGLWATNVQEWKFIPETQYATPFQA